MTDRHEQARAEADRRVRDLENRNIYGPANSVGYLVGHAEGVEWADANPQLLRVTKVDRDCMAVQISHDMPDEPMWSCVVVARNALKAIGIEVEDDDEA